MENNQKNAISSVSTLDKLKQSNEVAEIKATIQNYANNVGAILGLLQSLPNCVEDYALMRSDLDDIIFRYSTRIDEVVDELRAASENKESSL